MNQIKFRKNMILFFIGTLFLSLILGFTSLYTAFANNNFVNYEAQNTVIQYAKNGKTVVNYGNLQNVAKNYADSYIVIKNRQFGESHYAYSESVSDDGSGFYPDQTEYGWYHNSQMIRVKINQDGSTTEEVLLSDVNGVIRDPDVSFDGKTVLFSWKKSVAGQNSDYTLKHCDFHLYKMDLATKAVTQLTFGQGVADFEPKWLGNGNIVFSSTRACQTVDCWKVPVSNLYICDGDGKNIRRIGQDQVHTTFPTLAEDGRILYTRWDYNDRNQMYVQGVFQMNPDGTNQTELFGNNSNYPTTLLHTRQIPGSSTKYFTIVSGHHNRQIGRIAILDTSKGTNNPDGIQGLTFNGLGINNQIDKTPSQDYTNSKGGTLFKFPYPISENEVLYARSNNKNLNVNGTDGGGDSDGNGRWGSDIRYNIYYYNIATNQEVLICNGSSELPASQIVPIKTRQVRNRPDTVDYSKDTATYYVANVYEGDGLKGVNKGEAKYLRIVALKYRPYALGTLQNPAYTFSDNDYYKNADGTYQNITYIGSDPFTPVGSSYTSWDVKMVLGIVDIEEDGSASFKVPSDLPIFFQVLNQDGEMIQSMRSWSTLMGGEYYSCVGCHENKTQAPNAYGSRTIALRKKPQLIKKDLWMVGEEYENYDPYTDYKGFSYLNEIQRIFDESCVKCHNNLDSAIERANAELDEVYNPTTTDTTTTPLTQKISLGATWEYKVGGLEDNWYNKKGGWSSAQAGFGNTSSGKNGSAGKTDLSWFNDTAYFRTTFNLSSSEVNKELYLMWQYDETPTVYINGVQVLVRKGFISAVKTERLNIDGGVLKQGENIIAVKMKNIDGGQYFDLSLYVSQENVERTQKTEVFGFGQSWKYLISDTELTSEWFNNTYNVNSWSNGQSGFGSSGDGRDGSTCKTNISWTTKHFYAKKTFNLSKNDLGKTFYLKWQYDENPIVYVNGKKVLTRSGYTPVPITTKLNLNSDLLVEGENTISVELSNRSGGQYFDLALYYATDCVLQDYYVPYLDTIIDFGSQWRFATDHSVEKYDLNTWVQSVNNVDWWYRYGGFGVEGDARNPSTCNWTTTWIKAGFIREFNISSEQLNKEFWLYWQYDENPKVYINGTLVLQKTGFVNKPIYTKLSIPSNLLKSGTNTIAVYLENTNGGDNGGEYFDLKLGCADKNATQGKAFSLQSYLVKGDREKMYYPISYLMATGSFKNGNYYCGTSMNEFTNWISAISQCEMLRPYQYGSHNSNVIQMLRGNSGTHGQVMLSDSDIRKIACWIDLGCPLRGEYDELSNWNSKEKAFAEEAQNKQDFYNEFDKVVKKNLGKKGGKGTVTVTFNGATVSQQGYAQINVGKYNVGDVLTINVPSDCHYVFINVHSRIKTNLTYVENGTLRITFNDRMFNSLGDSVKSYIDNVITVWLPCEGDDLKEYNLAHNFFAGAITGGGTRAETNSYYNDGYNFVAENAIDGRQTNNGHGTYPLESWGPNQKSNPYLKVWFNRTVTLTRIVIYTRADYNSTGSDHDAYATRVGVNYQGLSSPVYYTLTKTALGQEIVFDEPITTNFITLKDFTIPSEQENLNAFRWFGITEFEAYGKM